MATIPSYELVVIDPSAGQEGWEALRQQCYDLRIDVYHHEQGFPLDTEIDEFVSSLLLLLISHLKLIKYRMMYSLEDRSTHILLRLVPSLKPVGTIRYTKFEKYSKLSRLVVLKEYRQYKLGRALVEALHKYAIQDATRSVESTANGAQSNVIRIACHSQIPVKGFYAKYVYSPPLLSHTSPITSGVFHLCLSVNS